MQPTVALSDLEENPDNPRSAYDKSELASLAASIKRLGIVQPLLVSEDGPPHRIIAGHRRYRAAKLADLTVVPVLFRSGAQHDMQLAAAAENMERVDLTPLAKQGVK